MQTMDKHNIKNSRNNKAEKVFRVYQTLDDPILLESWKKLSAKGSNYNLSPQWCLFWCKHFIKSQTLHQNLYIITLWQGEELRLLAPFFFRKKRLTLIGTKPDLYDEFDILYEDSSDIDKLVEYMRLNNLEFSFKYVSAESQTGKILIKKVCQLGIAQTSHVLETKPAIKKENYRFKRKQKDEFTRCKNNALKIFGENLKFDYSVEKKPEYIEEFIRFHKKRWGGGFLANKPGVSDFVRDIFLNSEGICVLSRLYFENSGKTAAYHLGFMDSNKKFCSSMPAYNKDYGQISPGKILICELIFYLKLNIANNNELCSEFDFGRGSEPYKGRFSNHEEILFNITSYHTKRSIIKVRNMVNKVFNIL